MPLFPCKDQAARIKALEDQVAGIYKVLEGMNNLSDDIIAKLKENFQLPEPDLTVEGYHR